MIRLAVLFASLTHRGISQPSAGHKSDYATTSTPNRKGNP
jgi:hypothetical protein